MNRKDAVETIKKSISCAKYLEKSKGGLYCCPFPNCGSGYGKNGTGAVKYYPDTNTWTCFSCNKSGDIIDLYGILNNTDFNNSLYGLADILGITIDKQGDTEPPKHTQTAPKSPKKDEMGEKGQNKEDVDFTPYYELCRECLDGYQESIIYLNSRGISLNTAKKCGVGFDPAADPANAPGGVGKKSHSAPRLIIPTSKNHYVARRTDAGDYPKINPKGGTPGIFNVATLYEGETGTVYVLEGVFDAMSIIEAGRRAIALNSAGNYKRLISLLAEKPTKATLVLCPDNDADEQTREKVHKQFNELAEGLKALEIECITADITAGYKDANEALTADKGAFIKALETADERANSKPDSTSIYLKSHLFTQEIEHFKDEKKTGFINLDTEAGGLYAGLYVLAAISSLGKTTFALQMAEQLAVAGNDVLFFSLEQSRLELMSKILSRRTVTRTESGAYCFDKVLTSLQIRKGEWSKDPESVRKAAEKHQEETGDRLSIIEGNFTADISFIGDKVKRYIKRNNVRPVVFVDYLQIIEETQGDTRTHHSTKEVIDQNIKDLKLLSRNEDITVIVISSVNRANYQTPIDFESIKESGNVEYSADVVWGLQLECLNEALFDNDKKVKEKRDRVREAKAENPRKIELVCLKNRYGKSSYKCAFKYYPSCDLFIESEGKQKTNKDILPPGWEEIPFT